MTIQADRTEAVDRTGRTGSKVILISSDGHIGPRVVEDLRPYVPSQHLEAYDAWRAQDSGFGAAPNGEAKQRQIERNLRTAGHHDVSARLRDMDEDGVTAEIVFHDSFNGEMMPFQGNGFFYQYEDRDLELLGVGYDVYNRWLADALSPQPARHVGLAYLPMWDVEAATAQLPIAREMGLRAVNFPAPRPGLAEYDDPAWEPFWAACTDLDMPLVTHSGGAPIAFSGGPQRGSIYQIEGCGWLCRRAMHRMIFGGVFERHPRLKLVFAEISSGWWPQALAEMDSSWASFSFALRDQVPRHPSEYANAHVFLGYSFPAPFEVDEAVQGGFFEKTMWGSDYPHPEGTWQMPEEGSPSSTHDAIRYACTGLSEAQVRSFLTDTAASVFGFDLAELDKVAQQINAPTMAEIQTPLETFPERDYSLSFRTVGPWG
ncbi:MAG TPA: amidohydrolase family protein [Acidimicrobiales bacterium]|nr:amidohydrolase family protein [Acidimicrobiales bacterium]